MAKRKRKKYKLVAHKANLADAFNDATSEVESLKDELESWRDNLEEKLSNTPKYEEVSECVDGLDNACSTLGGIDDDLPEREIEWSETMPYGRAPSRSTRCSNACAALQAVADALKEITAEAQAKDENNEEDEDKEDIVSGATEDWESTASEIEDAISELEGLMFPGMY